MRKSVVFTLFAFLFLSASAGNAFESFQLKPFIKFGAQDMDEPGDKGSRSFLGIGIQGLKSIGSLDYWAEVGGAAYWEAPDEKLSAPTQRLGANIGVRYNELFKVWKFSVSPFVTVGWHHWNRNINPDPSDPLYVGRFEEMQFLSAKGGVRISADRLYLDVGPTYPIWSDTDKGHNLSGKLGLAAFFGIATSIADVGLFYDSISFESDRNSPSTQPDFRFSEIGLMAIFKF